MSVFGSDVRDNAEWVDHAESLEHNAGMYRVIVMVNVDGGS